MRARRAWASSGRWLASSSWARTFSPASPSAFQANLCTPAITRMARNTTKAMPTQKWASVMSSAIVLKSSGRGELRGGRGAPGQLADDGAGRIGGDAGDIGHGGVAGLGDPGLGHGALFGQLGFLLGEPRGDLGLGLGAGFRRHALGRSPRLGGFRSRCGGLGLSLVLQPPGAGDVTADLVGARVDRAADP